MSCYSKYGPCTPPFQSTPLLRGSITDYKEVLPLLLPRDTICFATVVQQLFVTENRRNNWNRAIHHTHTHRYHRPSSPIINSHNHNHHHQPTNQPTKQTNKQSTRTITKNYSILHISLNHPSRNHHKCYIQPKKKSIPRLQRQRQQQQ
jgi:hypothetical protein